MFTWKPKDAHSLKFPQVNFTYRTPPGMQDTCGDLPVYRGENMAVSLWKFPWRQRWRFLFSGKMWIWVMMNGHPPISLTTYTPFREDKKQ
jgi:hypothetical protein